MASIVTAAWTRRARSPSLAVLGVLAFAPAHAQAAPIAGASMTLPSTVTVGQTGVPAAILLQNFNSPPNSVDTNSVCNAGDASPPCSPVEQGIVLVPACKQLVGGACAPAGADPGVVQISSTGVGRVGADPSCAGVIFDTAVSDPASETVRFTPRPGGARVTLSGIGATCVIDFTFSVLKSPAGDQNPGVPGTQTALVTENTQFVGAFGPGALHAFARGATVMTVLPAGPPTITTLASPDVTVAGRLTDQATVTGLVNPVPGATVTFRLYAPSAPTCTGTPLLTSVKPVALAGTTATATSDAFRPTVPGVHRWRVVKSSRRLDVLAPISSFASGVVKASFRAAGRSTRFDTRVESANRRVRINRVIPAGQARLGTGILTLAYPGDADTQPQEVRLRAAPVHADLVAGRPTISGGRLKASGRISSRARGIVRLQVLFEPAGQSTRTLRFSARISSGRYSLDEKLPAIVLAQIAARRGVVHSYTLFTGYAPASMRGEMASFQVLGAS